MRQRSLENGIEILPRQFCLQLDCVLPMACRAGLELSSARASKDMIETEQCQQVSGIRRRPGRADRHRCFRQGIETDAVGEIDDLSTLTLPLTGCASISTVPCKLRLEPSAPISKAHCIRAGLVSVIDCNRCCNERRKWQHHIGDVLKGAR